MATLNDVFKKPAPPKVGEKRETISYIHYKKLKGSNWQFYDKMDDLNGYILELASWIDQAGRILQPVEVRKVGIDEYEIISGHRRHQAVKYLVEKEEKEQFSFVPCLIRNGLTDVRAEFEGIATNQFGEKNDYIRMKEIERLEALIRKHPEEFPEMQGAGRLVEKLAHKMNMSASVVKELKTISSNLCEEAMDQFATGEIKKAAATELVKLPQEEQEDLVKKGITTQKAIKQYITKQKQKSEVEKNVPNFGTPETEKVENREKEIVESRTEDVPNFGTTESRWEKMKHFKNAEEMAEYLHSYLTPSVMLRMESILNWLREDSQD